MIQEGLFFSIKRFMERFFLLVLIYVHVLPSINHKLTSTTLT